MLYCRAPECSPEKCERMKKIIELNLEQEQINSLVQALELGLRHKVKVRMKECPYLKCKCNIMSSRTP
jgi:hypothetical protein